MGQNPSTVLKGLVLSLSRQVPHEKHPLPLSRKGTCEVVASPSQQELDYWVNVQPHTDEAKDPYYIGDAYEASKCASQWAVPYVDYEI